MADDAARTGNPLFAPSWHGAAGARLHLDRWLSSERRAAEPREADGAARAIEPTLALADLYREPRIDVAPVAAHILVVEENRHVRELLRDVLVEEGYRVSFAPSAFVPEAVRHTRPDLIVLEPGAHTHDGDGWWFFDAAERVGPLASIPVLLCTVDDPARWWPEARAVPWFGIVHKPFDLDDLLGLVRRGLDGGRPDDPRPDARIG